MANLSGQTIQSTYYGLLNLDTATTGITSTYQTITDGIGNDTGLQIKENAFYSNNFSADTYNDIFEYPGRWSVPTWSGQTAAEEGNTGFTGFFYTTITTAVSTNPTGLSASTDSNTYPTFNYLYKGEIFRGTSILVLTAASVNIKVALYEAFVPTGAWNTGTQVFRPWKKIFDIGTIDCSTTGVKYLDFPNQWVVPYTGLYYIMLKIQASSTLRLGGGNSNQLPVGRFTSQGTGVYRVDLTPPSISTVQPYVLNYWANTNYAASFPDIFDYTTGATNWPSQGFANGLHYVNQYNEI